ncbi:rhodanese-like domain-containing protein [Ignatzschineria sp. RMDPL8A]|uniref:rhodanese-like domain-containing protein n=1 Tax=Ignatzschineria sp. RMDPL8A TaxID=2999236 RepID=UPI0024466720|nr:rhodanese-like domain-containing protein [Ignatzschineria sp. RMDPL8A]MDG9729167.1 rhodanese-like domain-containing protein [Ignatzschineria sp. RMDPL8A]
MDFLTFFQQNIFYFGALIVLAVLIVGNEINISRSKRFLISVLDTLKASNNEEAIIFDLRAKKQFSEGHIPTAKHLEMKDLENKFTQLDSYRGKKVIFYCDSGARSSQACINLRKSHKEDNLFYSINGGIDAWIDQKLPVTKR